MSGSNVKPCSPTSTVWTAFVAEVVVEVEVVDDVLELDDVSVLVVWGPYWA